MVLNFAPEVFQPPGMSQTSQAAGGTEPGALAGVQIQLLPTAKTKARARRLLARHHYLGDVRAVGEQLFYAITEARGDWLGVLVFCAAHGWQELGATDGFGRVRRDFQVEHHKPKRLFARELCPNARRSLAADQLKPALAGVEAKTRPRSPQSPAQIRSLVEHRKTPPDYRARIGVFPLGLSRPPWRAG